VTYKQATHGDKSQMTLKDSSGPHETLRARRAESLKTSDGDEATQIQSLVSIHDVRGARRRGDVRQLSRETVREMACHFMAHSGDARRKELLKGMFRCRVSRLCVSACLCFVSCM
jgi:hypothetical protein